MEAKEATQRGTAALKSNLFEDAVTYFTYSLVRNINDVVLTNRSRAFAGLGQWENSIIDAKYAHLVNPTNWTALSILIYGLARLNMIEEALVYCDYGIALQPANKLFLNFKTAVVDNTLDALLQASASAVGSYNRIRKGYATDLVFDNGHTHDHCHGHDGAHHIDSHSHEHHHTHHAETGVVATSSPITNGDHSHIDSHNHEHQL